MAAASSGGFLLPLRSIAQIAAQFDYYISPDGSDTNTGSQASPWAITALQSKSSIIAGKRVGLLDGTYNVASYAVGGNAGGLQVSAANVTIEAVNPRLAVITTNYRNGGTSPGLRTTGSGITIRNVAFRQWSWCAIRIDGNNQTIEGCDFFDLNTATTSGTSDNGGFISVGESYPQNITIRNCKFDFHNQNGVVTGSDNTDLLGPIYRAVGMTVENCSFSRSYIGIGWKSFTTGPLTVRNCFFTNIVRTAIYGVGSDPNPGQLHTVQNCIFTNCGYAFESWDAASNEYGTPVIIRNNTFVVGTQSNSYGVAVGAFNRTSYALRSADFNKSQMYNNIVYNNGGTAPIFLFYEGSGATPQQWFGNINFNLYGRLSITDRSGGGGSTSSLTGWKSFLLGASNVQGKEATSISGQAALVNVGGTAPADFQLTTGSLGKNAGRVGGVLEGAIIDIGAWGGTTSIGHNFGPRPMPPSIEVL